MVVVMQNMVDGVGKNSKEKGSRYRRLMSVLFLSIVSQLSLPSVRKPRAVRNIQLPSRPHKAMALGSLYTPTTLADDAHQRYRRLK